MKKWKVNLKLSKMKEQDLRDKFEDVEKMTFHNHLTVKTSTNQCVQIAKEYAEKEAIEFAQWMHENTVYSGNGFYSVLLGFEQKHNQTLTECYQLFKNRENER